MFTTRSTDNDDTINLFTILKIIVHVGYYYQVSFNRFFNLQLENILDIKYILNFTVQVYVPQEKHGTSKHT